MLGFYEEIGKALEREIPGVQNSAAELLKIAEPLVRKNDRTGVLTMLMAWCSVQRPSRWETQEITYIEY